MDFIDDAARCVVRGAREEDDGDADDDGYDTADSFLDDSVVGEQEDEDMGIYRPWVAASVFGGPTAQSGDAPSRRRSVNKNKNKNDVMQEDLSDEDEHAAAAGTAGSNEEEGIDDDRAVVVDRSAYGEAVCAGLLRPCMN
jgi:hypothetical protein